MNKNTKKKIIISSSSAALLTLSTILLITLPVAIKDPFMYYRAPSEYTYNYALNNFDKQSINSCLIRTNDYNSIIVGSNNVQGFSVKEANSTFKDSKFLNVSFPNPSFKETNDVLSLAFESKKDLKNVIRSIDLEALMNPNISHSMNDYPGYLYDTNWANDICYLFNPYAIKSSWDLIMNDTSKEKAPSANRYIDALKNKNYGFKSVLKGETLINKEYQDIPLDKEEKEAIQRNIDTNLIQIAKDHPDTDFTYFIPPYSLAYFGKAMEDGSLSKIFEAKKILYESCYDVHNIDLYTFDNFIMVNSNLDNYYNDTHYGPWINSCILSYFKNNQGHIDRYYQHIFNEEFIRLKEFDYEDLNDQIDENDAEYQKNFVNPYSIV